MRTPGQPGGLGTPGSKPGKDPLGTGGKTDEGAPIQPKHDPDDTQPERNEILAHRIYERAVWAAPGTGGGHPKLSGGIEIDTRSGLPAPRGLNRRGQQYQLSQTEITARREARAALEYPTSVILLGWHNQFEVRTPSGNNYDVDPAVITCDCPDYMKQDQSGYGKVRCKHIIMVNLAFADPVNIGGLDWSTSKWADEADVDERTCQHLCEIGVIPAVQDHRVWRINNTIGALTVGVYKLLRWPFR